jgi:hypothetical protein
VEQHWSGPYRDDRMYVLRITTGTTTTDGNGVVMAVTGPSKSASAGRPVHLLLTYKNVPSLPVTRSDEFQTRAEATEYVMNVEPMCPRVSLEGAAPDPTPSWAEHLQRLHDLGFRSAAEGDQPRPDWAIRENRWPE